MANQTNDAGASKSFNARHPILEYIGEIPIREANQLSVYLGANNYRRIAKISNSTGLSFAKILAISGSPCECCKDKPVVYALPNGDGVEIPRGLLSLKKDNKGPSIVQLQKRNKKKQKKS